MHIYDQLKLSLPSSTFGKFLLKSLVGDEMMICIDVMCILVILGQRKLISWAVS